VGSIGFAGTLVVLVLGACLGTLSARRWIANDRLVPRIQAERAELGFLRAAVEEAQAAELEYLLTHDGKYLVRYEDARERLRTAFTVLRRLTEENPAQKARLGILTPKIVAKLSEMRSVMTMARSGQLDQALILARSDVAMARTDEIRREVVAMQAAELGILAGRTRESEASSRATQFWILLSALIGVGLVAGLFDLGRRALRERQSATERLAEQGERLREALARLEIELRDTRLLQGVSAQLVHEADFAAVYDRLLGAAIAIMGSDCGSMQMLQQPEGGRQPALRLIASHGFTAEARRSWEWVDAAAATTCAEALRRGERVVVADVGDWPPIRGTPAAAEYRQAGIVAVQSTPLLSRSGELLGMISTHWREPHLPEERELRMLDLLARQAADVIERKGAEEALQRADRRKDEFLAVLAHELRNPLAPMRNAAQYLKLRELADPGIKRSVEMVERQVTHMARLIDDLLDVSRIARGVLTLQLEAVDLGEVAAAALEVSRDDVESRGHTLVVELPQAPVWLRADRDRLIQVFCNLISNAVKYTPPGGRLEFAARTMDGMLEVAVKDSGVGIPREKLSEIFELFAQVNRSLERQGGLGIGLTLARDLVQLHGGTLEAHSDGHGCGSTFVVRLPVVAPSPAPAPATDGPVALRPADTPRRILVADDNRDAAESFAILLGLASHAVRLALDGEEAYAVAEAFRPDVVFLDIGMPRLNGYEVARRIREQPWGRRMLLVALTGWGQEADRDRARAAGFDDHLVKPASPEALARILAGASPGLNGSSAQASEAMSTARTVE